MLSPDRDHSTGFAKSQPAMKGDRCGFGAADDRDHLAKSGLLACLDQRLQQARTGPLADRSRIKVDAVLAGRCIGRTDSKLGRIGVADDFAVALGHQERPAMIPAIGNLGGGCRDGTRLGVERSCAVSNMIRVYGSYRGSVFAPSLPD